MDQVLEILNLILQYIQYILYKNYDHVRLPYEPYYFTEGTVFSLTTNKLIVLSAMFFSKTNRAYIVFDGALFI